MEKKSKNTWKLPLEGIVILDNSWVIAGPHGTRLLADLGATVVKIETCRNKDIIRLDYLRYGVKDGLEEAGWVFQENNRNKMGLRLNLKSEQGKQIYAKLVEKADVVVSNVTPKAIRSMGIDYETLHAINPRIISVNASGLGDFGCKKDTMIFAPLLNAFTGLSYTVGYDGQPGYGLGSSTAANVGGAMVAMSILMALEARDRTGEGQFVDLSEAENMLGVLGASLLEWGYNHAQTGPVGNHAYFSPACPHNAYRGAGVDSWIVIACGDDEEWNRFVAFAGREVPALKDSGFATCRQRKEREAELDELIAGYVRKHNHRELAYKLQEAGVSASAVERPEETLANEQLNARGFWIKAGLPERDPRQPDFLICADVPKTMPREERVMKPSPALGEDNDYILKEMLGLSDAQIQAATEDEAFY